MGELERSGQARNPDGTMTERYEELHQQIVDHINALAPQMREQGGPEPPHEPGALSAITRSCRPGRCRG